MDVAPKIIPGHRNGMCRHMLLRGVLPYGAGVFLCWMLAGRLGTGHWPTGPDRVALEAGVSLAGGLLVGFAGWLYKRRRRSSAP